MNLSNCSKALLGIVALVLLTPVLSSAKPDHGKKDCDFYAGKKCQQQVPDGGSTTAYLLTAGISVMGAMLITSRLRKQP
jgi:hypothetical protein